MKNILAFAATLCVVYITASSSYGQTQLPQPDPAFKGRIGETYKDSTPSFPMPVKVGSRVRGSGEVVEVEEVKGGIQAVIRVTVEIEGSEKPACVVDTISRYFPA